MASYAYTFTSGDTVTPTKLNNARTVSEIQTADISDAQITNAKLAANVAGNGPAFHAYAGTTTSLSPAAFAKVNLNAEVYDTNSNFASSRFTATVAGYYQFSGGVGVSAGALQLLAALTKNSPSSTQLGSVSFYGGYQNVLTYASSVSGLMFLAVGDYVELFGYADANATIQALSTTTYMTGCLVRAA